TFNDLYWQPGGNLNLKPETSVQFDINNNFNYKILNINISTYYTSIKNMIRWIPTNTGLWEANNVDEVYILGSELSLDVQKTWHNHTLGGRVNYAYTRSIDKKIENQLIYAPLHKFTAQLNYKYKNFSVVPSCLYIRKIYTTSSDDRASAINAY